MLIIITVTEAAVAVGLWCWQEQLLPHFLGTYSIPGMDGFTNFSHLITVTILWVWWQCIIIHHTRFTYFIKFFLLKKKKQKKPQKTKWRISSKILIEKNWNTFRTKIKKTLIEPQLHCQRWQEIQSSCLERKILGTSLVVQWLRLFAPRAGAQVLSLARKFSPTYCN